MALLGIRWIRWLLGDLGLDVVLFCLRLQSLFRFLQKSYSLQLLHLIATAHIVVYNWMPKMAALWRRGIWCGKIVLAYVSSLYLSSICQHYLPVMDGVVASIRWGEMAIALLLRPGSRLVSERKCWLLILCILLLQFLELLKDLLRVSGFTRGSWLKNSWNWRLVLGRLFGRIRYQWLLMLLPWKCGLVLV